MMCDSKCVQFKWKIGGYEFVFDPKLLKLGGCDMVLGVDFLHKYGPAKFDYDEKKVTMKSKFIRSKIKIRIQENQVDGEVELVSGNSMTKMMKKGKFRMRCLFMITGTTDHDKETNPRPELKELLDEFRDVFAEPTDLLPERNVEHQINLEEGSQYFKMQP